MQDAWRTIPEARELALQPSVLDLLGQLYGRAAVPFQTLHFRRGSEQAAHSDALHFHSLPHRYLCGVWVALEDISPDSGPLCVYPGSHRFPVWELQDMGLTPGPTAHHAAEAFVQRWVQEHELRKEVVCLKKGQAILWAANLLHAGEPIQDSTHTRWSQVTHYFFEDCLYFNPLRSDPSMGQMQLRKVVDIRTGQEVPHVYRGRRYQPTSEQMFWMQPSLMAFLRAVGVRIAVAVKQVLHQ